MNEIINKVAQSKLEVFDLEDYYQPGIRSTIDVSVWLEDGFLLIEKKFRESLKNHDWNQYQNHLVAIHCSSDAILPAWANILVTTYLFGIAKKIVIGNLQDIESALYVEILNTLNFSVYEAKAVILKGCSKKPVPESAYILAIQKLLPFAKSIMYGEACSAVPLWKSKK